MIVAIHEQDAETVDAYARAIGGAWPDISAEKRERLAVLFSGPWLNDEDDAPTKNDLEK